jgi:post-segregation antitoxin (ccd killing protein)
VASSNVVPSADERVTAITVPMDYIEDFRAAIVEELAFETDAAKKHRKELAEARWREDAAAIVIAAGDLAGVMDYLHDLSSLLVDVYGDEIVFDAAALRMHRKVLPYVFEAMARKVVGPRLSEEQALGVGPMDESWAADGLRPLVAQLSWAIDTAARLHTLAAEARIHRSGWPW